MLDDVPSDLRKIFEVPDLQPTVIAMIGPFEGALAGAALLAVFVAFVIVLLVVGLMLYIAGRIVVGGKATFGGAVAIAFLGTLIGFVLSVLLPVIGWVIALLAWLYLIKSFFKTGWLKALLIGIVAIVVTVVVGVIVGILFGITLFALL